MPRPKRTTIAAVAWTLFLAVALLAPADTTPDVDWPHADKLVHSFLFAVYGWLWVAALSRRSIVLVGVSGIALGLMTELLQPHLPWPRRGDVWDFVADLVGLAVGLGSAIAAWRNGRDSNPR